MDLQYLELRPFFALRYPQAEQHAASREPALSSRTKKTVYRGRMAVQRVAGGPRADWLLVFKAKVWWEVVVNRCQNVEC